MNKISLSFLGLVLFCSNLSAISVRTVNVVEMVEKAEKVFHGKCLSRQNLEDSTNLPIVEYTFEVRQAIKGVSDGEIVVFRQVDGTEGGRPGIRGIPQYDVGQEFLLFLRKESPRGLTSPVGMGQGTFRVHKNGPGKIEVMNLAGNRNLLLGLSDDQIAGLGAQNVRALASGRAISLTSLASAVTRVINFNPPDNRTK